MLKIVSETFMDSLKMVPFLLAIYYLIGWLEYRFGNAIQEKIDLGKKYNPLLGAIFGCIPQCGFSVVGTTLYSRRLVTAGTLIAIYLSTSDEAIPVILSQPGHMRLVVPLLATKVALALIGGYAVDRAFTKRSSVGDVGHSRACPPKPWRRGESGNPVPDNHDMDAQGCCGHQLSGVKNKRQLILHPLRHTVTVFTFVFFISVVINAVIARVGEANLERFFLKDSIFQPVVAALVGLIPSCATSVAMAQLFLKGGISFGSAIAGLSASGGLGLLVLFRENRPVSDTLKIVGILLSISITAGILIQAFYG